ncbi:MAG: hypothetical protein IT393_07310 [Nitrospirae bacterium]|nr:hypothetical protein [Nitrospirota bacterium]
MERKEYEIGSKKFYQQELVWGQIKWLIEWARTKNINLGSLSSSEILVLIQEELPKIMALVLIEDGKKPADKISDGFEGVKGLEEWINSNMTGSIATEVIADFFTLNRPAHLINRISSLFNLATAMTGSKKPLPSSATGTLQDSHGSSETLPQENPSLISADRLNGE